ncbi:hypothetical protein CPC735_040230 [Coccidioides posadasii C735 delta SOWgp]|nr:hypothetical protein CPC735_040230 [Coccidioides posadasii C735 delta SOWgp]EER28759.1 hypothetical protein CPC735_040230 [Coccidioides posadasii C735 delta SOWgp]|eukprot:XP_003070904.1 hypothetical protein CPC735_040230 [Coccidioides posadasii C735 delta SOWgp]
MDSNSSEVTRRHVELSISKPINLQIPKIPTFPLSSPITEEVMTPFTESDSPEYTAGRSNNPFISPEDYLTEGPSHCENHNSYSERNGGWSAAAPSAQMFSSQNDNTNTIKKTRPGLNLVTDFTRNGHQPIADDKATRYQQASTGGFLDLNDLKSLSKSKQTHERQDGRRQPTWKSKFRGYEELKDATEDSGNVLRPIRRMEKQSLIRKISRKTKEKPSKIEDLSPSDRPILIGMSIPTFSVKSDGAEEPLSAKPQQTPVTPSIVITPAVEERGWDAAWDNPNSTKARPPSSVYSQPTPFMKPARMESIPPVPAIPAINTFNEKHSELLAESPSQRGQKRRSYSAGTVFEEEFSPSWLSTRRRSFSDESRVNTSKRLSLETISTRPRSQGWWNILLSPLLSRSNTLGSCRGPPSGDSSPPPVPPLAVNAGPSYSRNVMDEKQWENAVSSFSPDTPESTHGRIQSNVTAWPDMDSWYKQRKDRDVAPRSSQSPNLANRPEFKASPESASSTQSVPFVMSTSTEHNGVARNIPCQHDLLSSQPCSACLSRSNIDRFLAEAPANSRGVTANNPQHFTFLQSQPSSEQGSNNPFFQKFVSDLRHDQARRPRSESCSTTIEDDDPEISPNIRQATATPLFKAAGATPALVNSPRMPSKEAKDVEPSNLSATGKISGSTGSIQTPESIPPPYSSPKSCKPIRYRAIFPPDQQPHSPGPISPNGHNAMSLRGGIHMSRMENIRPPPSIYTPGNPHPGSLPPRPPAAPVTLPAIQGPVVLQSSIESKRRRREKEDAVGRKVGGLWRGRGCFSNRGCLGRAGPEGRKRRRWYFAIALILLLLTVASVVLAVVFTNKRGQPPAIESRWLNLTGYPAIPTGISTVGGPDPVEKSSGCVHPSTMWSCALPKEDQEMNEPYDAETPKFRIEITFKNGTYPRSTAMAIKTRREVTSSLRRRLVRSIMTLYSRSSDFTPIPAPPNLEDMEFLGNTTDGIASPFVGEETPFYATFLSTGPINNYRKRDSPDPLPNLTDIIPSPTTASDGTAAPAKLLPLPKNQPLRLYDRGMPTERYGFYTYYDRSIFLKSVAPLNETDTADIPDDRDGGSSKSAARVRCTWAQTRFLVQIWTQPEKAKLHLVESSTSSKSPSSDSDYATDFSRPGTFPYPITIKLDRHGGDAKKKMVYCYGMNERSQIELNERKLQLEFRGFGGTLIKPAGGIFNLTDSDRKDKRDESWQPVDGGTGGSEPGHLEKNTANESKSMPQSKFLELPLELREKIYDCLLYSGSSSDPTAVYPVLYPTIKQKPVSARTSCAALACANNQINQELSEYIEFCQRTLKALRYEGSLILRNETEYFFSWTHLPIRAKHIQVLTISLSIRGARNGLSGFRGDGFGAPATVSKIHRLIFSILQCGPRLSSDLAAPLTVGRMDLNILTPQPPFPEGYALLPVESFRDLRGFSQGIIHPRTVADEIAVYTSWELEHTADGSWLPEGLSDRLGWLRILVDGEPVYGCDLVRLWAEMRSRNWATARNINTMKRDIILN